VRWLAFCCVLAASAPVGAQPQDAARDTFQRGVALYDQGKYREAIVQFENAYRLQPHPSVLFNIARCHENLGELTEALAYYQRMLADPAVENRADVEARVREIRERPVSVFLSSVPEGASVRVDEGDPLADRTPLVLDVRPGTHRFRFELSDRPAVTREVELVPAQTLRLVVPIPAQDAPAPEREPDTEPAPSPATVAMDGDAKILQEIRSRRESKPVLFRLGLLAGAAKYADVSFAVGADMGVIVRRVLANVHWLTYSHDFVGGIDLELGYNHPFPDFDFFVGGGAGYMRIRTTRAGEGGVIALPFQTRTVFDLSFVGGVDFFLRKTFAIGAALRLVRPFDDHLRDEPGNGDDAFSLQSLTAQMTIHL
jgi:hypothetical protein